MADLFKEVIPSILKTGVSVLENEKDYVPYPINMALSLHTDTILLSNEMNINSHLPRKMQYDFLLNKVRHYSRPYQTWPKKLKQEDLDLVQEYYNVSLSKSKEILHILSKEQVETLRSELDKGGL